MSISDNKDFKFIKKHYGEEFAKCCREWFPTLLEQPGLLSRIISNHIEPTKSLLADISEDIFIDGEGFIENFVYSAVDVEKEKPQVVANKTAEQLFDEAGYVLYPECRTEAEIQKFKKLYAPGEELCTFKGGRLNYCRVWFAVKKDVKDIKRENFTEPKRQDEYGTSVISIQYTKKEPSTLSIKNRYNHTVNNPDATFSNNLDNIAPGLTDAFEKQFCVLSQKSFIMNDRELYPYVKVDQKLFRYNFEYMNIYYCANNVIIDNFEVKRFDKARYLVIENYIIDKKEKTIVKYNNTNNPAESADAFTKSFGIIEDVKEISQKDGREVIITPESGEDIVLKVNDNGQLIEYTNNNITEVENKFLQVPKFLQKFTAKNLEVVGDDCLETGYFLETIDTPKLRKTGTSFLCKANFIKSFVAPDLTEVGDYSFSTNHSLENMITPNLQVAGHSFLSDAIMLKNVDVRNIKTVGDKAFRNVHQLKKLYAPNLKKTGREFLTVAENLEEVDFRSLEFTGDCSLQYVNSLKVFSAPNLTITGFRFMEHAVNLKKFFAPQLNQALLGFLEQSKKIEEYDCPVKPNYERELVIVKN